ncbi:transposase [Sulfitobacter mediterraneus]|uniref:helix-turn-helix domain-containing protein n=2 Tax=Sulfitobacter mediterraneus TaxID=83219 RepID=UPI001933DA0D|nr:helix-turn-helix domain-containing protein [Sulfitobacter mediterraneus]MBM1312181.1 transposase [Sulfitobacter mediterraneus]MBM1316038.1 transposase [Sulfitobacter mediterraneus]MBM1324422.1 transposase [Sulfitobacter mediterraneus]MBM1328369.1 transposase [Sulfitobacter mediterraneus]MBM1399691.1 transposase [Sulfitobacter mediterraneus]
MSRSKRLTDAQRMEIVREAANGVSTSVLAARFGVTPRAVQYTVKSDAERQRDTAVPVMAVSVKVTSDEMAAFDAVLASAGIETRSEGLRRLMQAAGGTFVADAQLAVEMARYRSSLNEVGNGVAQIAKQMQKANRSGQGTGPEFSELRLAQMRGLARFILDSADEIDLLVRRRRDAMQLQATAALREFAHAAE